MKMKSLMNVGRLLILTLTLAACSKTSEIDDLTGEVSPVLSFTCEPQNRSIVSSFAKGSRIGVSVTNKGTTNAYEGQLGNLNICYTLKGPDFWETSFNTNLTTSDAQVYGYYPYNADVSEGIVTIENGTDYLYTESPSVINRTSPAAQIKLSHIMALLRFSFDSSLGTVNCVRVRNLPEFGTFDMYTGIVTPSSKATNVDIQKGNLAMTEGLLVIPGNKIDVMVYTDNGNFVWKPVTIAESGKQYNIRLSAK